MPRLSFPAVTGSYGAAKANPTCPGRLVSPRLLTPSLLCKAGRTVPASHCVGPCQAHDKCSVNVLRFVSFLINY